MSLLENERLWNICILLKTNHSQFEIEYFLQTIKIQAHGRQKEEGSLWKFWLSWGYFLCWPQNLSCIFLRRDWIPKDDHCLRWFIDLILGCNSRSYAVWKKEWLRKLVVSLCVPKIKATAPGSERRKLNPRWKGRGSHLEQDTAASSREERPAGPGD